jgi:hypothetical protein
MGTRGFLGFVVDGQEKIAYNHFDSYPGGLGTDVLGWLRKAHLGGAKRLAAALRVVSSDSEPTDEDIERLGGYANRNVGAKRERPDWYQLLRETQGNPAAMLDAGVIEDGSSFPLDSLMAEWGYIVDFDHEVFEVYRGFQKAAHDQGRFAAREGGRYDGYYPVALIATLPLTDLPSDDAFVAHIEGVEALADES